jgi:predicted nucleic acid-binding protein
LKALAAMTALPAHDHWSEAPPALQMATLNSLALVGHRHVTDAYLLGLAAHQGQCLATLDKGLESYARALGFAAHTELVGAARSAQEGRRAHAAAPTARRARR